MSLLKKVSGIMIIAQLFFGIGSPLVNANEDKASQETIEKEERSENKKITDNTEDLEKYGSAITNSENPTSYSLEETTPTIDQSTLGEEAEKTGNENEDTRVEETEETTADSASAVSTFAIEVQASGEGTEASPQIVENEEELIKAVETDKVNYIKLADAPVSNPNQVFELTKIGRIRFPGDCTIDGNGRTVSYTSARAFEANAAGSYVKFKNITFGSPDFTIPADDYYGFCQVLTKSNVTLEVENVNYYSNKGAQPFYNQNKGGTVVFSGTNNFVVNAGSLSQEFAECSQFLFKQNSQTIVKHNTGQPRAIWATSAFRFDLEENATVDFQTTASDFVGLPADGGEMSVGKNASLTINGDADFVYATNLRNFSFNFAEQSRVDWTFGKPINVNTDSTFHIGKDSIINVSITNDSKIFYNRISPANIVVDNADRMTFDVANTSSSELLNAGLTFNKFMEGITSYGITADNEAINTVINEEDIITAKGSDLEISNTITAKDDFTTDEKTAIRNATRLVFQRLPTPSSIQNVKSVIRDTKAVFNLTEYLSNGNTLEGAVYQLFETKQDTDNFTAEIHKEEIKPPLSSEVTFSDLDSEKDYWLYVQLKAEFSSGDSQWYEVPFKTKSSVMSVTIPTSMFFKTETEEDGRQTIHSPSYSVRNNSAYPVAIDLASFEEKENSDIELLDQPDADNSKGLLLQLTKNHEYLTTLNADLANVPISKLDTDESSDLRFAGEYYGPAEREINVDYKLTLNFKKAEE